MSVRSENEKGVETIYIYGSKSSFFLFLSVFFFHFLYRFESQKACQPPFGDYQFEYISIQIRADNLNSGLKRLGELLIVILHCYSKLLHQFFVGSFYGPSSSCSFFTVVFGENHIIKQYEKEALFCKNITVENKDLHNLSFWALL